MPQGGETHEGSQDRRAPTGKRKIVLILIRIMIVMSWHRDNETNDDDYEGGDDVHDQRHLRMGERPTPFKQNRLELVSEEIEFLVKDSPDLIMVRIWTMYY